ncbi:LLM class flavin-dependent oxidoreductase [Paracraurococcus lichenis]|uniref:LLM class flavin-dependent oxidoreductase n=1 Tax=Paracraurococcus lichenis TaxID=3064888 RepID=A0ABT9E3K3_9PROT|nr:LLM class flavin-dependent oxidoreductase [Paracraurococcus sp. LOR1-02]MDO9710580.1 LLM class flavin-dependent oxidoreductase [Paracraurococcus sp. LOR1-02]
MKVALGLGLAEYPFASAAGFWRWVDLCEQAGADSIWQTDRIVSRSPILECLSVMAALAGRTRRMKFGMNVLSLAFRDPVLVAKQCATIDVLSEGRLLPAFGIGSPLAPEWQALGLATKTRGRRTDEALEIVTRLWREESVDFAGQHWRLSGASIAPRPLQAEIPVWIGGGSEAAIRRTARFGTGWQAGGETPEEARAVIAAIRHAAAEAGRSIDEDHYGAGFAFWFGSPSDAEPQRAMAAYRARTGRDPARGIVAGDAAAILDRIADYVGAGVTKFVLRPVGQGDEVPLVQTRLLLEQVLPRLAARWPKQRID